jgi:hypothetical protein
MGQLWVKRIGIGKTAVRRGTEGHDLEGTDGQDGTEAYILNRIIRAQPQTQRGERDNVSVQQKKHAVLMNFSTKGSEMSTKNC